MRQQDWKDRARTDTAVLPRPVRFDPPTPLSVAEFRLQLRSINGRVRRGEVFLITSRSRPVSAYGPPSWARGLAPPYLDDVTMMDVRTQVASVMARAGGRGETLLRVMEYGQCVGVLCPHWIWQTGVFTHLMKESIVKEQQLTQPSMTILTVWNEAGGATKTSLVAEIGYVLSQRLNASGEPNRVLLVDLDPQRSLTRRMGLLDRTEGNPKAERLASTLFMAMQDPEGDLPEAMVPPVLSGLRVFPAHTQMRMLDGLLINDDATLNNLGYVLRRMSDQYDYVLIDTPPSNGGLTRAALVAADYAVVPVPTQIKGVENIENVALVLGQCRRHNPNLEIACFVPTLYNSQRKQDNEVLELLTSDFSQMAKVTSVITERAALFRNVIPAYTTVGCDSPSHKSTAELNQVLNELLGTIGADTGLPARVAQ